MSLLTKYNSLLLRRPLLTNALTTGFLFGSGDYLAQALDSHPYDPHRTLRATIYGSLVFAPLGDKWYKLVARIKCPWVSRTQSPTKLNVYDTVVRVAADQLVFAPFIGIPLYYSAMTILQTQRFDWSLIQAKLHTHWWPTLRSNWMVWPAFQFFNFGLIPVQLRLLVCNLISIGWNCHLSLLNHK